MVFPKSLVGTKWQAIPKLKVGTFPFQTVWISPTKPKKHKISFQHRLLPIWTRRKEINPKIEAGTRGAYKIVAISIFALGQRHLQSEKLLGNYGDKPLPLGLSINPQVETTPAALQPKPILHGSIALFAIEAPLIIWINWIPDVKAYPCVKYSKSSQKGKITGKKLALGGNHNLAYTQATRPNIHHQLKKPSNTRHYQCCANPFRARMTAIQ